MTIKHDKTGCSDENSVIKHSSINWLTKIKHSIIGWLTKTKTR